MTFEAEKKTLPSAPHAAEDPRLNETGGQAGEFASENIVKRTNSKCGYVRPTLLFLTALFCFGVSFCCKGTAAQQFCEPRVRAKPLHPLSGFGEPKVGGPGFVSLFNPFVCLIF